MWAIVLLLVLNHLGVNITALVAGLGIGGVAVALALQNVLGDLLASLAIVLDKPFVVGDAIAVGEVSGQVERVGIKTTRLRSVDGEQLVVSNADLLKSRIRNFRRMTERRVLFGLGIAYETPHDKLARVPEHPAGDRDGAVGACASIAPTSRDTAIPPYCWRSCTSCWTATTTSTWTCSRRSTWRSPPLPRRRHRLRRIPRARCYLRQEATR